MKTNTPVERAAFLNALPAGFVLKKTNEWSSQKTVFHAEAYDTVEPNLIHIAMDADAGTVVDLLMERFEVARIERKKASITDAQRWAYLRDNNLLVYSPWGSGYYVVATSRDNGRRDLVSLAMRLTSVDEAIDHCILNNLK